MTRRLSSKQTAFIAAYTGSARGVGVAAARIAGYSGGDAALSVRAAECLRHPEILAAIAAADEAVAAAQIATVSEAQEIITSILRDPAASAKDRLKAARELCLMRGAYVSKLELTGAGGGPVEMRVLPVRRLSDAALAEIEAALAADEGG